MPKSAEDIIKAAQQALEELAQDFQATNLQPFREWAAEVAPKIATYATLAAAGSQEAAQNLNILRAIATAKASKLAINGLAATDQTLGNIAVFAAKLVAALLL